MLGRLLARGAVAAVVVASCLGTAAAGPPPRETAPEAMNRISRTGPFITEIRGKANFRVPTGFRFVVEDKLTEFGEATGFPAVGDEAGYIAPAADKSPWFAVLLLPDDPLKGIDPKTLGEPAVRDKLLDWERKFHDARRPRRVAASPPSNVGSWTHPPKYDEKTKVLTMGVRLDGQSDGLKDRVNYQTFTYGPAGAVVCVSAYADAENYDKAEKEAGKLATEFTFLPPAEEKGTAEPMDPMYLAKVAGAGIVGAVGVVLLFRLLGFGSSRGPVRSGVRRPAVRRS